MLDPKTIPTADPSITTDDSVSFILEPTSGTGDSRERDLDSRARRSKAKSKIRAPAHPGRIGRGA
jgi:hypothetical protein